MKLVSWNVNGLRACIQKGFLEQFNTFDADFFCLQETKLSEGQLQLELPGYEQYWCYAEKKGYSGTAIFTKHTPQSVHYGLDVPELDNEGRLITLEYPEFFLVNCYTPNAQRGLARIGHRMTWDDAFRAYLQRLDAQKPVIVCGDLNVAHREIDLKNPKSNHGNAGFSDEERASFQKTLDLGFTDTFRHLHPDAQGCYSWWSYMFNARQNNAGWRIDYFLISNRLQHELYKAEIHSDVLGSDHCPVSIQLDTLCNGGLWSPMSEGKATQTFPAEKEPKASAVNAKALAPFLVILGLVLCTVLAWKPLTALFPSLSIEPVVSLEEAQLSDLISIERFDSSSAPISSAMYQLSANDVIESISDSFFLAGERIYTDNFSTGYYTDSNYCLRISLTEEGKRYCDKSWVIRLNYEMSYYPGQTEGFDSALTQLTVPYYSDAQRTDLAGWFVFGKIISPAECNMTFTNDYNFYSSTVYIAPFTDTSLPVDPQIPVLAQGISVTPYYTPLTQTETYVFDEPGSMQAFVASIISDSSSNSYFSEPSDSPSLSDATFWFRVELTNEALNAAEADAYSLDVSFGYIYTGSEVDPSSSYIQLDPGQFYVIRPYYSDYYCTELAGWFVYGNITSSDSITFKLLYNTTVCVDAVSTSISHYISEAAAANLTTAQLMAHIASNQAIQSDLNRPYLSGTGATEKHYETLFATYPALNALTQRDDAVETVMTYDGPYRFTADPSVLIFHLLEIKALRKQMTPHQEARFLLGLYAGNETPPALTVDKLDPTTMTTAELVSNINLYGVEIYTMLQSCKSYAARDFLYSYLHISSPMLSELASRDDALAELTAFTPEPTWPSCIPYIQDYYVSLSASDYASMTTQTLVEAILQDEVIVLAYNSIDNLYDGQLALLPQKYPVLAELIQREDSVAVLMNYSGDGAQGWETVPEKILGASLRWRMTPQQEADFLTGNYPNASRTIGAFSLAEPYLSAYSTEELVAMIQSYTEFGTVLAKCYSDETRLLVYDYIRGLCNVLPKLESRSNTLDVMTNLMQSTSNPKSGDPIPYLIDLWPQILSNYLEIKLTDN